MLNIRVMMRRRGAMVGSSWDHWCGCAREEARGTRGGGGVSESVPDSIAFHPGYACFSVHKLAFVKLCLNPSQRLIVIVEHLDIGVDEDARQPGLPGDPLVVGDD